MRTSARGFTLFEVVISMLIVTVAIISSLMILPVGLRAERLARARLVASATALSLFDNFHKPLVSFRGHGPLAPDLDHNLRKTTPDQPPVPGWAQRLRDINLVGSTYQPDFEHALAGWVTGVAPVPLEIARRLDSEGGEIERLLDDGGTLLYVDPNYVHGLSVTATRDKAPVLNPPPEAQRLVFGVVGYAQENTLPSHPLESWPWYELYPFPPAWVAMRAHGCEYRRGPVHLVMTTDPRTGAQSWFDDDGAGHVTAKSTVDGRDLNGHRVFHVTDQGGGRARGGLVWGDGGHSGWDPVWFDPAPCDYLQLAAPADQTRNRIDADDPREDANWQTSETPGWYQGRNWRFFKDRYGPGTPWSDGWVAFQRLAGFNYDVGGGMTQADYASNAPADARIHYERSGWLPVLATLLNRDDPGYDHPWWTNLHWDKDRGESVANPEDVGTDSEVGTGKAPPTPPIWGRASDPPIGGDEVEGWLWRGAIGAPNSMPPPATYEMRASYRDRAIDLWNAVTAGLPFAHPQHVACDRFTPEVLDTEADCDMYEFGPAQLDAMPFVLPEDLPSTPHPAQVLALSYLAHAAMMITGWDVPFASWSAGARLDWDILTWQAKEHSPSSHMEGNHLVWDFPSTPVLFSKDAKIIAPGTTAAKGSDRVQVKNDGLGDMVFWAGDFICFESDYREWYRRSKPSPGWATNREGGFYGPPGDRMLASCRRYRVRSDLHVAGGATGELVLDPPLVTDITDTTKSYPDSEANPFLNPPLPIADPHPQQLIRVCNEHDRAFARKVHEMCMRWAQRYCADNPYDWGAPRMMNHQVSLDKPLVTLDLFEDAARGPDSDGRAQRDPQDLPTRSRVSPTESFYRWLMPPNPQPRSWFPEHHLTGGVAHEVSHLGPGRSAFTAWNSLVFNKELAPPPAVSSATPWNYAHDDKRYWVNRHFNAFHRCRQLVFWSVDWKSYEDAETAPSAPLDWAKHARSIQLAADGTTPTGCYPMGAGGFLVGSQYAGNPESGMLWATGERNGRWIDNTFNWPLYWTYADDGSDINLGHWGADRNGNRRLDVGPVPRSARMRAETVARFEFYDPIMRVNVDN